jgi:uncharacterized protein YbjQ (UPF0145 family)
MKHRLKALIAALFCAVTIVAQDPDPKPASLTGDIFTAARKGDLTALQQHIDAGIDIEDRDEEHKSTPLHHAAYFGQLEAVKWLVKKGAGMNARDNDGSTPLDVAYARMESDEFDSDARRAKREVGEYLESIGADKNEGAFGAVLGLLCCFSCPALFVLGILYAAFTKPKPEEIPTPSKPIMVTTSPQIAGKKVVRTIGLVRGNTIRARHLGRDIMAGLRNLVGGEVTEYGKLLAESREQALDRMLVQADELGANAVIGLQFQTSVVMEGAAEMMAFATAVVVEDA